MDILEKLKGMGATPAMLESKTVKMVLEALAEDGSVITDTAKGEIQRLVYSVNSAASALNRANETLAQNLARAESQAKGAEEAANRACRRLQEAQRREEDVIMDKDMAEAVKAYKAILVATREVFGDMIDRTGSADAIIAAIQAGSYTAWRGIMGPKDADQPLKAGRRL